MLIYRVQDDTGEGPFTGPVWYELENAMLRDGRASHNDNPEYPSPGFDEGFSRADRERFPMGDSVCGCASMELIDHWFPPCTRNVLRRGLFEVTVWDCPDDACAVGEFQVIFDRDRATMIDTIPITEKEAA